MYIISRKLTYRLLNLKFYFYVRPCDIYDYTYILHFGILFTKYMIFYFNHNMKVNISFIEYIL